MFNRKFAQLSAVFLATLSAGAIAIGVSACGSKESADSAVASKDWTQKYFKSYSTKMSSLGQKPIVAKSTTELENAIKQDAQQILKTTVSDDKALSGSIKVTNVTITVNPALANKFIGDATVKLSLPSNVVSIPNKYSSVTTKFSWKPTNNFFEWNELVKTNQISKVINSANPSFFSDLILQYFPPKVKPPLTVSEMVAKNIMLMFQNPNHNVFANIFDAIKKANLFTYNDSYQFADNNLAFSSADHVLFNKTTMTGTFNLNLKSTNKNSDNILTYKAIKAIKFSAIYGN